MKTDDFIANNVNDFSGDIVICDSYVVRGAASLVLEIASEKSIYTYIPELSHIDQFGFKLTTVLRMGRVSSLTIFTKDGSPHSLQMPLVAQEAAQNVGFPSSALRFFVVEKNRLVAVSAAAVRAARHLSEVNGLLKGSGSSAPAGTCFNVETPGSDRRIVAILVGGHSDVSVIKNSGMMSILQELGIAYELSIISSEQNPEELRSYCLSVLSKTARLCICIAGLVPGLPAVVKAHLPMLPVISVPISLPGVDARDILLASFSLPSRRPVVIAGVNETGLKKAAHLACELLASSSPIFRERYQRYITESTPLPEYNVSVEHETGRSPAVMMSATESVVLSTNGLHKGKQQC